MSQHNTLRYRHGAVQASQDLRDVSNIYHLKTMIVLRLFFSTISKTSAVLPYNYLGFPFNSCRADTTAYYS